MASLRDIKRRKGSVSSTGKITKAMKLVSTVKLQKARHQAEAGKAYFQKMYETIQSLLQQTEKLQKDCFLREYNTREKSSALKKAVVVISSNKGLAGGYNSNLVKKVVEYGFVPENTLLYTIGQKAKDILKGKGYVIWKDKSSSMDAPNYEDGAQIGKELIEAYFQGQVHELYLAYTEFVNTVYQVPRILKLLPVEKQTMDMKESLESPIEYDPDPETVLEHLIPIYIQSLIYGAMVEAVAAENGARMQAMDTATVNAEEMLGRLSMEYNRARQRAITQELTEMIAGAETVD